MKACSKCHQLLPLTEFWWGPNKTGTYPSCRNCESLARIQRLNRSPICKKCAINPHPLGDYYCTDCARKVKRWPQKKWVSRRTGLEWCKVCGIRERLSYHHYCHLCKQAYQRNYLLKKPRRTSKNRRKMNARQYATNLLRRGKIKRGPCVFCGKQGTEFHHFDYEDRTRNFVDVCVPCHDDAHRLIKILLTIPVKWV